MNVAQAISRAARWYSTETAVVDGNRRLTFRDVDERSNRLAQALLALDGTKGERVALLLRNCAEFLEVDWALAKANKVKVPLNTRLNPREWLYILQNSGATTLVYHSAFAEFAEVVSQEGTDVRRLIRVGEGSGPGEGYEDLLTRASPRSPDIPISPDDINFILYTSGTTGRPKGAVGTHLSRLAATRNMLSDELDLRRGDAMLHVAPLTHGSGSKMLAYWIRGGRSVMLDHFDPELTLWTIEKEHITGTFLVPTMINALVEVAQARRFKTSSLRNVTYGGAPISPDRIRQAIDTFGQVFVQVYGSCEAPHPVLCLRREEHVVDGSEQSVRRLRSAGHEVVGVEVKLVDDAGREVEDGEVGELVVRGDNVMAGYWKNEVATAEVLRDGWYFTGDMGWRDEHGFITITDRKRELIISGGMNIYPAEVEDAISSHPAVAEVAVIGVPDPFWGEAVKAFVVLRPGHTLSEEELIDYCRGRIASYKKPRFVEFVHELPKGASGKILKRELRNSYWQGRERMVN